MVKKFKEFNEKTLSGWQLCRKVLPTEELEDQFLRLKEIIGCHIVDFNYNNGVKIPHITVRFYFPRDNDFITKLGLRRRDLPNGKFDEIHKELENIKYRMESMFPVMVNISDIFIKNKMNDYVYKVEIYPKYASNHSAVKENIKESKEEDVDLSDILPRYEVEDNFLRLKEVFGITIGINYSSKGKKGYPPCSYYLISLTDRGNLIGLKSSNQSKIKIVSEIEQIKRRMEFIYPVQVNVGSFYIHIVSNESNVKLDSFFEEIP